jgi:hypothetical protein
MQPENNSVSFFLKKSDQVEGALVSLPLTLVASTLQRKPKSADSPDYYPLTAEALLLYAVICRWGGLTDAELAERTTTKIGFIRRTLIALRNHGLVKWDYSMGVSAKRRGLVKIRLSFAVKPVARLSRSTGK